MGYTTWDSNDPPTLIGRGFPIACIGKARGSYGKFIDISTL